jgi:hypothetical protein
MPVRATPADATSKWVTNLSGSTERIKAGVARVTVAPGQRAAAQSQKWLQRVTASQDKWRTRVGGVSLQSWQASMTDVGIPRVAQGAQAKQAKFQAFASEFFPYLQQGVQRIDAMPSTTLEDSINRAVAMIRHNAGFKRGSTMRTGG